jgi:ferrous iron transport protein B
MFIHTWERTWQYMRKAGTVILAVSVLLWAAMTFPGLPEDKADEFDGRKAEIQAQIDAVKAGPAAEAPAEAAAGSATAEAATPEPAVAEAAPAEPDTAELEERLKVVENEEKQAQLLASAAGRLGTLLEPVTSLAGFDWRTNIALVGGFAAKEVIVSTLGTAYSLGEVDTKDASSLSEKIAGDPAWSMATAAAFIIFVLLYAPCMPTVVMIAREASWGWAAFSVTFNTALAFGLAVAAHQLGRLLL